MGGGNQSVMPGNTGRLTRGTGPERRAMRSGVGERSLGPLVPVRRDEHSLGLLAAGEHHAHAEEAGLRDDLGQVGASFGDAHAQFVGLRHALRIHTRRMRKSVLLYNSEVDNISRTKPISPADFRPCARGDAATATRQLRAELPLHFPLRKLDRDAPTTDLLTSEEARPGWYLNLWPYLYRVYDAERLPLYIGISSCHGTRLAAHRRTSDWWDLAEYIAISAYPTAAAVEKAEGAALRREKPRFNRQGVRGPANVKLHVHGAPEEAAALLFQQAAPEFVAELTALLSQPSRFPQPAPPPPAAHRLPAA
jgi:hypothetical protein